MTPWSVLPRGGGFSNSNHVIPRCLKVACRRRIQVGSIRQSVGGVREGSVLGFVRLNFQIFSSRAVHGRDFAWYENVVRCPYVSAECCRGRESDSFCCFQLLKNFPLTSAAALVFDDACLTTFH
jgi:hypothetical protein